MPTFAGQAYSDVRITQVSIHQMDSSGKSKKWHPAFDPDIVALDLRHAAEASGLYWTSKSFRGTGNINRACDLPFDVAAVSMISWLVNGGDNGLAERQQFSKFIANVLLDQQPLLGQIEFSYPSLLPHKSPALCETFPPAVVPFLLKTRVHHDRQIP